MSIRALGQQFMSLEEVGNLQSQDWGGPVSESLGRMQEAYDSFPESESEEHLRYGGPMGYIQHLAEDIRKNGVREPLEVSGDTLLDGHHRAFAAARAGLKKVPVHRWGYS